MSQPITEQRNTITENIDAASPADILNLLKRCDEEIFTGFRDSKGVFCPHITATIEQISDRAATIIKEDGLIVFSGCGTSGRFGFMTARTFNHQLKPVGIKPCYEYIIAGGDKALLTSQELYEDDPIHGVQLLNETCAGKSRVLYIGITCGLSAPFVAGQLDYCLEDLERFTPVLLGFNHVNQARNRFIEKWDKTFLQVAQRLEEASVQGKAFILNPIIGPEPITGSSRMKGGSTTKILLDLISTCTNRKIIYPNTHCDSSDIGEILNVYRSVLESVHTQSEKISHVIEAAGNSLRNDGHVYYIGEDTCGILGLIDASECRPTYGAALDDVRGFIKDGYTVLGNKSGDISNLGAEYQISSEYFYTTVLPGLTENDLLIYCNTEPLIRSSVPAKTVLVEIMEEQTSGDTTGEVDITVRLCLPRNDTLAHSLGRLADILSHSLRELAVKLVFNAISTGAHVIKGKVFKNLMVDVRISNNKLYHRGISIIQTFTHCSTDEAEMYLLRSIHNTDTVQTDRQTCSITTHIQKACEQPKIVPVALILALTGCTVDESRRRLSESPQIGSALLQVLKDNTNKQL